MVISDSIAPDNITNSVGDNIAHSRNSTIIDIEEDYGDLLEQDDSMDYGYKIVEGDDADGYENIRDGKLGAYHTYEEIVEEITELAEKYPDIIELEIIGKTWENRDIYAVHITNRNIEGEKPAVLYTAQTHAREVISAEVGLELIRRFAEDYGKDKKITELVDKRDIWVVPCVNPDGSMQVAKEVKETNDSSWRKNKRPANSYDETGVDLNRNYPVGFGIGASDSPSSDIYAGPEPFSEPETSAIKNLAERVKFRVSAHLHSFSGLILFPYGYTEDKCPDHDLMEKIAKNMQARQKYEKYKVEKSSDLYVCGGAEDDYLYSKYGTLAFTIEIGQGYYGPGTFRMFNPPEKEIKRHVENNIDALIYLAEIADNPYQVLMEDNINPVANKYLGREGEYLLAEG